MQIQECTIADVPMLAVLNKQLIDDEKSDNPMTISELENRMSEFLNTEYSAYFFFHRFPNNRLCTCQKDC